MGQVKAVGVGWREKARKWGGGPRGAWAPVPTHSPGIGDGSSCRVGWDVRINIHLPMHMDNAHSCPACLVFIRSNCFRSRSGRREGAGPIHRLRAGGRLQLCKRRLPPGSASRPLKECCFLPLALRPTHCPASSWRSQGGKGAQE